MIALVVSAPSSRPDSWGRTGLSGPPQCVRCAWFIRLVVELLFLIVLYSVTLYYGVRVRTCFFRAPLVGTLPLHLIRAYVHLFYSMMINVCCGLRTHLVYLLFPSIQSKKGFLSASSAACCEHIYIQGVTPNMVGYDTYGLLRMYHKKAFYVSAALQRRNQRVVFYNS